MDASFRSRHTSRAASMSGAAQRPEGEGRNAFNQEDGSHAAMWSSLLESFQDEFLSLKIQALLDRRDAELRGQDVEAESSQPGTGRSDSQRFDAAEFRLLSDSRIGRMGQAEGEQQGEQAATVEQMVERARMRNLSMISGEGLAPCRVGTEHRGHKQTRWCCTPRA